MLQDTKAVAELLGLKPNTLEIMRVRGDGPRFVKIGRRVLYRPQDIDTYVESHLRQSTSDKAA